MSRTSTLESRELLRRVRRVRLFEALSLEEVILSIVIVGILIAVAARAYEPLVHRAELVEIIQYSLMIKYDAVLHHAETGRWPTPSELRPVTQTWSGKYTTVPRVQMSQGSFNLVIRPTSFMKVSGVDDWNLSFLGENLSSSAGGPLLWRCGYAPRSAKSRGYDPPNLTDVPAVYLPSPCRR